MSEELLTVQEYVSKGRLNYNWAGFQHVTIFGEVVLLPSYVTSSEFHAQLMYEKNMNSLEVLLLYSRVT